MTKAKKHGKKKKKTPLQDLIESQSRPVTPLNKISSDKADAPTATKEPTAYTHGVQDIHFIRVEINKVRVVIISHLSRYKNQNIWSPAGNALTIIGLIISLFCFDVSHTRTVLLTISFIGLAACIGWIIKALYTNNRCKIKNDQEFAESVITAMTSISELWDESDKYISLPKEWGKNSANPTQLHR